jgi:hypothetical protein
MRVIRSMTMLLLAIAACAEPGNTPPVLQLRPTGTRDLGITGFQFAGNAQCDSHGNLFFHSGLQQNDSLVLRLGHDGTPTLFKLPGKDAETTYFVAFRVNSEGKVHILARGEKEETYVYTFADDATSPTKTRVDTPDHLAVENFAVLRNGHILLQGYFDQNAAAKDRGRSYVGEFSASGTLIRKKMDQASADAVKYALDRVADAAAAEADNGYIYLLDPERVVVLSQSGEIVKRFQLHPPDTDFRPYNLYLDGRRLVVAFYKTNSQGPLVSRFAVLDATTGEQLRMYEPAPELGNNLVCFADNTFTFYRVQHRRVNLAFATP